MDLPALLPQSSEYQSGSGVPLPAGLSRLARLCPRSFVETLLGLALLWGRSALPRDQLLSQHLPDATGLYLPQAAGSLDVEHVNLGGGPGPAE